MLSRSQVPRFGVGLGGRWGQCSFRVVALFCLVGSHLGACMIRDSGGPGLAFGVCPSVTEVLFQCSLWLLILFRSSPGSSGLQEWGVVAEWNLRKPSLVIWRISADVAGH